jgi:hypothetical protein
VALWFENYAESFRRFGWKTEYGDLEILCNVTMKLQDEIKLGCETESLVGIEEAGMGMSL